MQYFEFYDVSEIAVIETRCKNLTNIKSYAIIIHDKDLLDSWEPKKKHFHIVLTFKNATTIWAVAKWLWVECQYIEKIRTTTKSAMLYLVHRNNPEKFQYDPKEVKASFDYVEYVDWAKPMQQRDTIAEKIAKWEIKQYNLYDYISVDEFARNRNYYNNCFLFRQQKMKTQDRDLRCVFISGPSGCWKTTFAKDYASELWYNCYISSGWKHPLDNYEGQECIILDDIRPTTYEYNDLLKLTDNHTDSLVGCRFYNKSIAECKLIIITTVIPIREFAEFWADKVDKNDTAEQLLRRFSSFIAISKDFIQYYYYEPITKQYEMATERNNYITKKYQNSWEWAKQFVISVADIMEKNASLSET